MYGLFVKMSVEGDPAQYEEMFTNYAKSLNEREGFVMKTWLTVESGVGGFYIFDDQQSAQRYVDEMLIPTAEKDGSFAIQDVHHFPILATLSDWNHTPAKTVTADSALPVAH